MTLNWHPYDLCLDSKFRCAATCRIVLTILCVLNCVSTVADAAEPSSASVEFFEKKIRPVLVEHCYRCHAADAEEIQGGLLLDTREGIRRGGASGPAVTPGSPAESLLLDAISYASFEMPPTAKLPDHVIADFEAWIRSGAADSRTGPRKGGANRNRPGAEGEPSDRAPIDFEQRQPFWAFQPPQKKPAPVVQDTSWPLSELDHYLLAPLEAQGLQPAPDADRPSLLRRIYFTLIGLPPTPSEIEVFCEDPSPLAEALARVVDRLLATEQYGQRWGRHWFDVVRYADSSGGGRSAIFNNAWRYRDYVIDAFNRDLPYNQFLQEQIAGDLMEAADWQQRRRLLTATAFLVLGPTNYELQDKDVLEMDIVDEQLDTIGKAFLGMTFGCARCHDHKFDPVPTRDYYAMAGIFKSTVSVRHDNVSVCNTLELPLSPEEELGLAAHTAQLAGVEKEQELLQAELKRFDEEHAQRAVAGKPPAAKQQRENLAAHVAELAKKIQELKSARPQPPVAMAVSDRDQVGDIPLAIRGVAGNRGPIVPRGMLRACSAVEVPAIPSSQSGRLQMAEWMTHPQHPLTARVFVNRVWYWLFGEGLVSTVDNFGAMGATPSHPELLDYLALRFVEEGWSIKGLIRRILLSRTYRMSTSSSASSNQLALEVDPENRLLWRLHRQRLDAESIRDTMLFVGGKLDMAAGGLTIAPGTEMEYGYVFQSRQRSVYLPVFRNRLPQLFEVFDFADPNIQAGWRASSTAVPQSHYLMNHPFVIEMSTAAAKQLLAQPETTGDARLQQAFRQVLGRSPSDREAEIARRFLGDASGDVRQWGMFYQTLFQSLDFRYLN